MHSIGIRVIDGNKLVKSLNLKFEYKYGEL